MALGVSMAMGCKTDTQAPPMLTGVTVRDGDKISISCYSLVVASWYNDSKDARHTHEGRVGIRLCRTYPCVRGWQRWLRLKDTHGWAEL